MRFFFFNFPTAGIFPTYYSIFFFLNAPRDGTTTAEITAAARVSLQRISKGKKGITDSGDISEMKISSSGCCSLGLVK